MNAIFKQFLLRLEVFSFFLLITNVSMYFLLESFLNIFQPLLVFPLHFRNDLLVHIYDLRKRFGNGVSFLLQIGDLVH